jgi:4-hydroxy-2-oxoglutarate aldolase
LVRLEGVLAPICTPFDGDGEIDHDALRRNIARYNGAGLAGFAAAGSTGEAGLLNRNERLALFRTVREAAGDGMTLLAGCGVESVRETRRMIGAAADIGYHAALVITPHYYRGQMLRPESQIGFYRAVADSSPLPVLIYDFPGLTGIDLSVETIRQLAEHPNVAGIKETSPDLDKIAALINAVPRTFRVVVGSSAKFYESLGLGAVGGILALANALPEATQSIYDLYKAGDFQASSEAQRKLVDAAGTVPKYGIQGLKYAMDLKGLTGGLARLPLLPLDERQKEEIEELFAGI